MLDITSRKSGSPFLNSEGSGQKEQHGGKKEKEAGEKIWNVDLINGE